jgi:hypothetical protein
MKGKAKSTEMPSGTRDETALPDGIPQPEEINGSARR